MCKSPLVQNFDLSSVREIFSGAAPLGKEQAEEVTSKLGIKCLRQGYGMTELSPTSHFPPRDAGLKHGSGGMILPNTECKIVGTETGKELSVGQDGEVCVRGPQVRQKICKLTFLKTIICRVLVLGNERLSEQCEGNW